ncbi:MAG TPA: response regulator [Nitrososphaeraceae archaeon]|jgi:DNA-binding response OmpR family regulator
MILIVDVDYDIASLIKISLEKAGLFASAFTDPVRALEQFRSYPTNYALLLSDIVMPNMDGYELVHQVKRIKADVKILNLIAFEYSSQYFTKDLSNLDIAVFIEKPISMAELCIIVRNVIDNKPLAYSSNVHLS